MCLRNHLCMNLIDLTVCLKICSGHYLLCVLIVCDFTRSSSVFRIPMTSETCSINAFIYLAIILPQCFCLRSFYSLFSPSCLLSERIKIKGGFDVSLFDVLANTCGSNVGGGSIWINGRMKCLVCYLMCSCLSRSKWLSSPICGPSTTSASAGRRWARSSKAPPSLQGPMTSSNGKKGRSTPGFALHFKFIFYLFFVR